MRKCAPLPAGLDLQLIDDSARSGGYCLVFGGTLFAVARMIDGEWQHSSGFPVDFTPTHYHAPKEGRAEQQKQRDAEDATYMSGRSCGRHVEESHGQG